jgi:uncharacterized protein (TIGR03067 family)
MSDVVMRCVSFLVFGLALLEGCANDAESSAPPVTVVAREGVDGAWKIVHASREGPMSVDDRLEFAGGKLKTLRASGTAVLPPAKFSTDQNANPPTLDLHFDDGIAAGVIPCVYSCDGHSLTIVFGQTLLGPPGQPKATPPKEKLDAFRPTGFDGDQHQVTLKRVDDMSQPQ